MKRLAILVSMLVLAIPLVALAQSGGGYDLSWSSIDGGGGTSSGGSYTLSGTIGQPDANVLAGGDYILGGAFWGGGALAEGYQVYLPIVVRQQSNGSTTLNRGRVDMARRAHFRGRQKLRNTLKRRV